MTLRLRQRDPSYHCDGPATAPPLSQTCYKVGRTGVLCVSGRLPTVSLPNRKDTHMTRLIQWITHVIREPETESAVHFHTAGEASPEVCYDAHCGRPALDI
jgi:hypothetical protein